MSEIDNKMLLIIAGVGKAGTTSLFQYLSQHVDICPSDVKEVNHFSTIRYAHTPFPPFEDYLQHFSACSGQPIFMEASPGYFPGGRSTAERIKRFVPNPRFIIVFREPISRLFSFYNYYKSRLRVEAEITFDAYIERCMSMPVKTLLLPQNKAFRGVYESYYDQFLLEWLDVFQDNKIRILFFEELFKDIKGTLDDLCGWLDIERYPFLNEVDLTRSNRTMLFKHKWLQNLSIKVNNNFEVFWRRNPKIKQTLRSIYYFLNGKKPEERINRVTEEKLQRLFAPHNQRLAAILQQHGYSVLPNWLKDILV